MHTSERLEYAALSDRMTALLLLRLGMAVIVAGWAIIRPEILGIDLVQLLAVSGIYAAVAVANELGPTDVEATRAAAHHGDDPPGRSLPRLGDVRDRRDTEPAPLPRLPAPRRRLVARLVPHGPQAGPLGLLAAAGRAVRAGRTARPRRRRRGRSGHRIRAHAAPQRDVVPVVRAGDIGLLRDERAGAPPPPSRSADHRRHRRQARRHDGSRPPVRHRPRGARRAIRVHPRRRPGRVRRPDDHPRRDRQRRGAHGDVATRRDRGPRLGPPRDPRRTPTRAHARSDPGRRHARREEPPRRADDRGRPGHRGHRRGAPVREDPGRGPPHHGGPGTSLRDRRIEPAKRRVAARRPGSCGARFPDGCRQSADVPDEPRAGRRGAAQSSSRRSARSCSSTSTISRWSTTRSAMRRATPCCRR